MSTITPLLHSIIGQSIPIVEVLIFLLFIKGFKNKGLHYFYFLNKIQFSSLLIFVMLALASTLIYNATSASILFSFRFIVYFFLVVYIGGVKHNSTTIENVFLFFYSTLIIINIISIIDYLGFVDIPFVNEYTYDLSISDDFNKVSDMNSIYRNRSQYSVFLGLTFPISLYYLGKNRMIYKFMFLITIISILLCLSRGVMLSAVILLLIKYRKRLLKKIFKSFIYIGIIFSIILSIVPTYYGVIEKRFNAQEGSIQLSKGDELRISSFTETMEEIHFHPIGYGWGNFYSKLLKQENRNPHNSYVTIIRAAGIIGIILIFIVILTELKYLKLYRSIVPNNVILDTLLMMLFFMVTHDILATTLIWVYIGILLSTKRLLINKIN